MHNNNEGLKADIIGLNSKYVFNKDLKFILSSVSKNVVLKLLPQKIFAKNPFFLTWSSVKI